MGTAIMMYVLPMMLGQTYDLGKEKPGLQIFSKTVMDDAITIQHYFTDSQYKMVDNVEQIKDFLDVSGKLSLKIKSGMVDVSGEGSYLKDSSEKTNGLEILVKLHFETVTKTIPSSVKPNADWAQSSKKYLGTHFCRSITYGGDLIASIRISASNKFDLMDIKAAINGEVKASGGSFEANVKGRLEILKQNAQDSSSMEINYYASVPIHGVSYDIDGLMKLVDEFPSHVKKVNKGMGNPLRMELYPLSSLKDGYPAYFENSALTEELNDLESQFDDLRQTRRMIGTWMASLPPIIPEKIEKKIQKFADEVNTIYGTYLQTVSDLDMAKGASTKPINNAFDAYRAGDYIMPQKYLRQFRSLQKEIYEEAPELKPMVGGAKFVHWGRGSCLSSEVETSVAGVITASDINQNGGSSDYFCSPVNPHRVTPQEYIRGYDPAKDKPDKHLLISPLRYRGEIQRFESMVGKTMACAVCRTYHRTAVFMKPADRSCPENWVKEYEGYLMAPGLKSPKGQFICMDKDMAQPSQEVTFGSSNKSRLPEIQEVTVKCGSLPCKPYEENKPIPCVVCSI